MLAQVLCVVGSSWVGIAAKLGRAHMVFWLAAMALFYLPLAAVVIYLNRLMPLEGGLYQWAKAGFGEMAGFLTAWNLWVYAVIVMGAIVFVVPTDLSYMLGPRAAWLPASKLGYAGADRRSDGRHRAGGDTRPRYRQMAAQRRQRADPAGLRDSAGAAVLGCCGAGAIAHYEPFPWQAPEMSWFSLAIFGQMTVGALSGFEYVAILAGECRSAERTIGQSVMISAPVIALMFILGTSSVLAFVGQSAHQRDRPDSADHAAGLGHGRARGMGRAVRHFSADGPRHCRRQPDLHRPDAAAHDGRLGPPGAALVRRARSAPPHAGEFHPVCGRCW